MSGVLLAIVALLSWGFADFFVQKSARQVGVAVTLFAGGLFGTVLLTPFVYREIGAVVVQPKLIALFALLGVFGLLTALFSLEAYRKGKLAVIEPVMGLELPITILLAVTFRAERLGGLEAAAIALVFLGLLVTVTKPQELGAKGLEKGVLLGLMGAVGLGATNFLTGVASQETSALLTVWFSRIGFALAFGAYLAAGGRLGSSFRAMRRHALLVFGLSAIYLAAFYCYAVATTRAPISIVTAISENYIVVAALLGVLVNKEKLSVRQLCGVGASIVGVLALAYLAS